MKNLHEEFKQQKQERGMLKRFRHFVHVLSGQFDMHNMHNKMRTLAETFHWHRGRKENFRWCEKLSKTHTEGGNEITKDY